MARPKVPATLRLAIYSEAYRLRLTERTRQHAAPPATAAGQRTVRRPGARVHRSVPVEPSVDSLVRRSDAAAADRNRFPEQPWLAELATWEWSVAAAFDGADAEPAGIDALAAIAPEQWPRLTFQFHPTVQVLAMRTNAPVIFKALSADDPPPECVALDEAQSWLIWREGLKTQYRSLGADEVAALAVMRGGGSFEMLCDALCAWHDADAVPAQAAGLLKRWVVEQMIVGVS